MIADDRHPADTPDDDDESNDNDIWPHTDRHFW